MSFKKNEKNKGNNKEIKKILILGSRGRMGVAILKELEAFDVEVYGVDKGDMFPRETFDLMIDFSSVHVLFEHLEKAKEMGSAYLTGITGLSDEQIEKIKAYGEYIPVLFDYNMSVGINTITSIINQLRDKLLGYDIEIIEAHHKHKKDAPSGTAKKLFNKLNDNNRLTEVNGREGESLRQENEVGVHAVRGGGIFGEHSVRFIDEFEEVSISHRAFSRTVFARGSVKAGLWLMMQEKGFYNMLDYLES